MSERNRNLGKVRQKCVLIGMLFGSAFARLVKGGDTAKIAVHKIQQCYAAQVGVTKTSSPMFSDKHI
jgi:hypothetical protein